MTLSQALEAVAKFYEVGCVAHYEKQSPDPWQANNVMLEHAALSLDARVIDVAAKQYVSRAKALVAQFRAVSQQKAVITPADIMIMGFAEGRAEAALSVEADLCFRCGTDEDTQVERASRDSYDTRVICSACIKNRNDKARHVARPDRVPERKTPSHTQTAVASPTDLGEFY